MEQTIKDPAIHRKPEEIIDRRLYLAQTLDPVHVGTGEFQLGRVDNTIVREAGTNLPKIPGSSLAGVIRAYMAWSYPGKENCAGKGDPKSGRDHCGRSDCPICVVHGFSKKTSSFQGLVQFSDARILFFPVYTIRGPQWVTSPAILEAAGVECTMPWTDVDKQLREGDDHKVCKPENTPETGERINLGWLYLEMKAVSTGPSAEWRLGNVALSKIPWLAPMLERIVVVDDELFSMIVEDQLEVRTSVSIDPKTGTAAGGALFTAEAIPRATYLYFHVTAMDPQFFLIPDEPKIGFDQKGLHKAVDTGMKLMEFLGVGASGTRGLGRTRAIEVREAP